MDIDGLLLPGLLALASGAVAARRLPVGGLVVVLGLIVALAVARLLLDWARPTVLDTVLLVALVQAGYLASALVPRRAPRDQTKAQRYDKGPHAS